jgi:hypothetical protein
MWSRESIAIPVAEPRIQRFGSGLGHSISTSKRGAMFCAAALPLRTNAAPRNIKRRGCFIDLSWSRCDSSQSYDSQIVYSLYAMRNSFLRPVLRALGATAILLAVQPATTSAHDIPASVAIRAYVRPVGNLLHMVVRVPLESIRDFAWPVRAPGYLQLARVDTLIRDAAELWIANQLTVYEGGRKLPVPRIAGARISLPSDRSFESFDRALGNIRGAPLDSTVEIAPQQAMLDVALEYPIAADTSRFSIDPSLARLGVRTTTVLHFLAPGRGERVFQYHGDPGLVHLDPRWHQAALSFVKLGFEHILDGIDHLLFVFCLVIPVRRLKPLIAIVTSFTIAHSITLIAAANGFAPKALWFPPFIELLIAASIVYMAFENIVGARVGKRWMIAFGFGLVHGFGFSFALSESLQFAGSHLLTSLLTFNVGVELGQILVLLIAVPILSFFYRRVVAERMGIIILSALVAHTAWHWMSERGAALREYNFEWPVLDAAFAVRSMRVLMFALILGAVVWLMNIFFARPASPPPRDAPADK